ncbi:hydroxyneurosporene methyltransferase [Planomonospora sp. ID91781]|uniref:methyltransferase n=1 Tax=Planomonospora sp. ID91781 TaxID=2738135 RepID=UPI0018C3A49C|nr:methyltransferase [Planomonospora sp. ID91781]MBG0825688.1 hydroxyneurosporene methyltransferase [Planomonospora sp. ID91781]
MTDTATTSGPELPQRTRTVPSQIAASVLRFDPAETVQELLDSEMVLAALTVFAEFKVADHLAGGPLPLQDLAERCAVDPARLERILRILIPRGFVRRDPTDGLYHLELVGQTMRSGVPGSMRPAVLTRAFPLWVDAARMLPATVRTGRPAAVAEHGAPYDYLAERPEKRALFQEFMTARSTAIGQSLVEQDLSKVQHIVDVGGGRGTILAALLRDNPHCMGTLLERDDVVQAAEEFLGKAGLQDRCAFVAGDFFTGIPTEGDLYLLASILHNYDDERAHAILKQVHVAMAPTPQSVLWCVDWILPDNGMRHPALAADIKMLSLFPGGKERTRTAYRELLSGAGFTTAKIVPLTAGPSLIIAQPVRQ